MGDEEIDLAAVHHNVTPIAPPPPIDSATATSPLANGNGHGPEAATELGDRSVPFTLPTGGQEFAPLSEETRELLQEQGYTAGLTESLQRNKLAFPLSIWIVDNSGSMETRDGYRLVETFKKNSTTKKEIKQILCTRWAEMQNTVEYHAQLAAALEAPTIFRLLNDPGRAAGPQQFSIAERGRDKIPEDLEIAARTMENAGPEGSTPLIPHLEQVRQNILALERDLRRDGTKVLLVVATDGLPTNDEGNTTDEVKKEFVEALKKLELLPVWIVIRLCTNEKAVVDYWNAVDSQLEMSLDVLDDYGSEAQEVRQHNGWLNCGLPLYRVRERGFHHRLLDILDERSLDKNEIRQLARLLFGNGVPLPDPDADWRGFFKALTQIVSDERKTWNPIAKKREPWINLTRLKRDVGEKSGWFW